MGERIDLMTNEIYFGSFFLSLFAPDSKFLETPRIRCTREGNLLKILLNSLWSWNFSPTCVEMVDVRVVVRAADLCGDHAFHSVRTIETLEKKNEIK